MKKEDFEKFVKLYVEDPKFWYFAYYENAINIVQVLPEENLIDHLVRKVDIEEMISEIEKHVPLEYFIDKQYFETFISENDGMISLFLKDQETDELLKIYESRELKRVFSLKLERDLKRICVTEIIPPEDREGKQLSN